MIDKIYSNATFEFEEIERIGDPAGCGELWKAFDPQLNALVAVKKILIEDFKGEIEKYFEESKKIYRSRHHHVAEIYCAGKNDSHVCIVMPLYTKGSVKGLMDQRFLTAREIVRYGIQFLSGLHNIHTKGLLHFDLKPENILLSDSNQALITDFGLAQYVNSDGISQQYGTTEVFAPPEYYEQVEFDKQFDIYQAGLTLYRMCVGAKAFDQQFFDKAFVDGAYNVDKLQAEITSENFPDRSAIPPHIPKQLHDVISKSMKKDTGVRYKTALEMLNDLCAIDFVNQWQYSLEANDDKVWTNENKIVRSSTNGINWSVEARRPSRRIKKFCGTDLTEEDKNTLLGECLTTEW